MGKSYRVVNDQLPPLQDTPGIATQPVRLPAAPDSATVPIASAMSDFNPVTVTVVAPLRYSPDAVPETTAPDICRSMRNVAVESSGWIVTLLPVWSTCTLVGSATPASVRSPPPQAVNPPPPPVIETISTYAPEGNDATGVDAAGDVAPPPHDAARIAAAKPNTRLKFASAFPRTVSASLPQHSQCTVMGTSRRAARRPALASIVTT